MTRWIKDRGLTLRMILTMFLLALIYLGFITFLYIIGFPITFIMIIAGVLLFIQYYFSDKIVLMSMGARIVNEHEAPELHAIVRRLCVRANLPMPKIAIVDTPIPNAFATGRNPKNAVVAVTTGLLRTLNKDELEAVLGHELSHIKNKDVMVLTIGNFLATVVWFVMEHVMWWSILGDEENRNPATGAVLFVIATIVWLICTLLVLALSRYREFAADAGSAILTGKPHALISALAKISGRMDLIDPSYKRQIEGLNAFFIVPAISGETIMSLFSTHPPVEKRIERLRKIAREMGIY